LESGKSADALKYSAQRERTGMYNPKASNPPQRSAQIGEIIQFARYGDVPRTGESYDYRDQVGLDGLSVYHIIDGKEDKVGWYFGFTDRPRHEGIGRVVGYGPDGEPLVRVLMLDGEFYEPEIDLDWEALQYSSPEKKEQYWAQREQDKIDLQNYLKNLEARIRHNPEKSERTYYEIGHRGLKSKLWYGDEFNINVEPAEFDIDGKDVDPRNLHNEWALRMPWHGRYDPYSGEVSIMGGTMTEDWRQPSEQMLDRLRETFGADVQIVQFNPGAYNPRRGFR
jgi:hypothetical protein